MKLKPFKLERYFVPYEFSAKYLLSCSDCDGLPQKEVVEMADEEMKKAWEELSLGYTESLGNPLLRKEVTTLYSGVSPEDVLIITPEEGIFIALNTILNKGDHVICTFPGYQSLYEIAEGIGCEVTKWQPKEQEGWRFDPLFLENNIRSNTKLLIINFPNNPTGYLPSVDEFKKIINVAKEHNLYLLSDEMYRYLELNEKDRLPSACELYTKAISLFGMSKTFGMAGVRIGWLIIKEKEKYAEMAEFKDYTTICSSAPSEILSTIALRAKDTIINRNLKKINKNLLILDEFFKRQSKRFEWIRPRAGTIGFPKLKNNISSFKFCQEVVNKTGIMLLPSTVYDFDDNHFRIGFGRENMPEALGKFEIFLKDH